MSVSIPFIQLGAECHYSPHSTALPVGVIQSLNQTHCDVVLYSFSFILYVFYMFSSVLRILLFVYVYFIMF